MSIWVDASGWPVPPTVLLGCLVTEVLYFRGWRMFVRAEQAKAERARAKAEKAGETAVAKSQSALASFDAAVSQWHWGSWSLRGFYFLSAIITILLAASAPIDILAARLFWIHMIQHLLLLVVAAPLLVAGAPLLPLWLGLPRPARRLIKMCVRPKAWHVLYRVGYWLRIPAVSCAFLIVGTWAWHWPPLYDLALTNGIIHDWCEHLTFLAVSALFWTQVITAPPLHVRARLPGRIACVGVAVIQNVVLAALIGFAQAPLYAPYAHFVAGLGGLSAVQDQQLGAGIMWTFGDLPFGIAFSVLLHRWLTSVMDESNVAPGRG
jgi:putative membrane protein